MKVTYANYYLNSKQNVYSNNTIKNSNNISFKGSPYYMEHLTTNELSCLSNYAKAITEKILPTNMVIGPTFDTIDKIMKIGSSFSSLPEFLQLALRAENGVTNKMLLKAKYFSCLCAERYPKENYSEEVDNVLSKIDKLEPVLVGKILQNPLWNYQNILQRQADWISVNQAIIRECDEREKTVNIKLQNLDDKFTKECLELRAQIQQERCDRETAISMLQKYMSEIAEHAEGEARRYTNSAMFAHDYPYKTYLHG